MSVESINQKLNSMLPETPPSMSPEVNPDLVMNTDVPPLVYGESTISDEGTQVAGLFGAAGKIIKKAGKKADDLAKEIDPTASEKARQKIVEEADKAGKAKQTGVLGNSSVEVTGYPDDPNLKPIGIPKEVDEVLPVSDEPILVDPHGDLGAPSAPAPEDMLVIKTSTPDEVDQFISGKDAPAIGIDFNFKYIQDPTDIDRAIDQVSRMYSSEMDAAKRGILSDDVVNDLATRINMLPELLKAEVGTTFNAEQLVAARHLLVRSAKHLDDLSEQVKALGPNREDDALLLEFRNQLATHAAIQMKLKAAQTEAARALRSFRLPVDGVAGISDPTAITNLLTESGGRATLRQMAEAYGKLSLEEKGRFVQAAGSFSDNLKDIWKEMYVSSIMYSPATTERNLYANMIMTIMRGFDTTFGATVGRAIDVPYTKMFGTESSDKVYMAEAAIEFSNFFYAIPNGLKAGLKAFVDDAPVYVGRDVDKLPTPAISARLFKDPNSPMAQAVDFAGKAVRLPFRTMMAGDETAKAIVAQMETRRQAARQALMAIENGMSEEDAINGMVMQIINPDPAHLKKVDDAVKNATLQSDMGDFGNFVMQARNKLNEKGPFGTVLIPFVKTVINMEKELFKRTIFAPAMKEVRDELAAGGARRQMAIGKMSMGASLMGMSMYFAMDGTITGAGPVNPKRREFLRETTGWQPYSIKMGDKYVSYAGLEPIGGLLAMGATLAELGSVYGKEDDGDWSDLLLYATLLPFKYIGELPFMSGMSNFTSLIETIKRDPSGEEASAAANRFFGGLSQNFPGGIVPIPTPAGSLIRQIEATLDPTKRAVTADPSLPHGQRELDFMFRNWLSKTPILSESQAPTRNVWGEEVTSGETGPIYWIAPFYRKEDDLDPMEKMILQISKDTGKSALNKPSRVVNNIKLNDNEYSDLIATMNSVTINGKPYKLAVAEVLTDPTNSAKMADKAYAGVLDDLSRVSGDYMEQAYKSPFFMNKYPDLAKQIILNEKLAKMQYLKKTRETE